MKRVILAVVAIGTMMVPVASASRGPILTKTRAWMAAREGARYVWLHTDRTTGWAVEPAASCARRARRTVDCEYEIYDESVDPAITCSGTMRVRLTRFGRTTWDLYDDPSCS